jgi:ribosomal protein S1
MPKKATKEVAAQPDKTPKSTPKATKTQTSKKSSSTPNPGNIHPMELLLQGSQMANIKRGAQMDATIMVMSKKGVFFDIGAKAHAALGDRELKQISTYLPYLKVGDQMRVRVISEESREGFPVVSMQRFFEGGKWDILKEKREREEDIEVICGEYGKGGVFVDFMGIRGIIPKIQLTEEYLDDPKKLEGQKIKVKVLEVDQEKNRLIVSQKAFALGISHKDLRKKFDKIKVGQKYMAKVLGHSEFGIFCEVEGVEGLVHISEISWEKVSDVGGFIAARTELEVAVVEKNETDLKLNLSVKRLSPDPWAEIEKKYPKDREVEGEIIRRERYGYFVRLAPGIEGLIHVSKLAPGQEFQIGAKVNAFIERITPESRKLSLVLAQKEIPVTYR